MLGKTPLSYTLARVFTFAFSALLLAAPFQVSARQQTQNGRPRRVSARKPPLQIAARQQTQEPGAKRLTQPKDDVKIVNLPDRAKRYAVVIGIDKYTSDPNITPLRGAANDARAIATALKTYAGFEHVILLTSDHQDTTSQPTGNIIWKVLTDLKNYVDEDSMLVVAFSGHGVERKSDHQVFLLPQDALANPDYYERTAISVNQVKEFIKQTKATQVMLLLDSCRNDPTAGKGAEDNKMTKSYLEQFNMKNSGVKAFVTFYAAEEGQRAWEYQEKKQGYFSWAFVEGLKGAAKDPETGEVTLGRLIEHMQTEVPKLAKFDGKVQKPYVEMDGYGGSLVLAKLEPSVRKVVPAPGPVTPPPAVLTTGSFSVVSESGARIEIVPLSGDRTQARIGTIPEGQSVYNSGPLPFGAYRITATREGFVTNTSPPEELSASKATAVVPLELKKATYTLTVKANVQDGSVSVSAKGGPTVVYKLKEGRAVAPQLSGGEYTVTINPDDVGFQPATESVNVNGDLERDFKLVRGLMKVPLDAQFGLPAQWRLPAGWSSTPALEVNGEGRAMLREEVGRLADFELSTNVELLNGTSVSFIVRALDEQNYYLVRLCGPRADTPNMLRFFVVKNGQEPRSLRDMPLHGYNLSEQFTFDMKVIGSQFEFFIDDYSKRSDGTFIGLDQVGKHPDSTFATGSMGIAAGPNDKAKIFQYLVCPGLCPKQ